MKFHNRTDNTSYVFVLISVSMQRERDELVDGPYRRDFLTYDNHILDGDIFLQALNGFLMILDCNGELFFATHTIETYLGFHQSDVIHQSVYELVHSEDREELQRQLGMCKDFIKGRVFLCLWLLLLAVIRPLTSATAAATPSFLFTELFVYVLRKVHSRAGLL